MPERVPRTRKLSRRSSGNTDRAPPPAEGDRALSNRWGQSAEDALEGLAGLAALFGLAGEFAVFGEAGESAVFGDAGDAGLFAVFGDTGEAGESAVFADAGEAALLAEAAVFAETGVLAESDADDGAWLSLTPAGASAEFSRGAATAVPAPIPSAAMVPTAIHVFFWSFIVVRPFEFGAAGRHLVTSLGSPPAMSRSGEPDERVLRLS